MDHLRWSTQRKSVQKITVAELLSRVQKTQNLWKRKAIYTKNTNEIWLLWTVSEAQWSTQSTKMKTERTRVWINAKVEFLWERELNTKCCTQKIYCGSECRSTQLNWTDTEKMKLLLLNFNARKRTDLSRSTTCVHSISTQYNDTQMLCSVIGWLITRRVLKLVNEILVGKDLCDDLSTTEVRQ